MCQNIVITKKRSFTGYKVAVKSGKSYYSPSTGAKYEIGKKLKPLKKTYDYGWVNPLVSNYCFKNEMIGNTAIFENKVGCKEFIKDSYKDKLVILKMRLKNIKYEGEYLERRVMIGNGIESIEEV